MLPDDSNPSWPLTSLAAACERIRSASASNRPMILVFQPFLFERWEFPIKTLSPCLSLDRGWGRRGLWEQPFRAFQLFCSQILWNMQSPVLLWKVQLIYQLRNPNNPLLALGDVTWSGTMRKHGRKMIVSPCSSGRRMEVVLSLL